MNTLILVLKFAPVVLSVIRAIEDEIPEGGKGKEKLEFIQSVVSAVLEVAGDLAKDLPGAKTLDIVTKIVNAGVSLFNKVGIFSK